MSITSLVSGSITTGEDGEAWEDDKDILKHEDCRDISNIVEEKVKEELTRESEEATVAALIPNHECHSIKWTINQIPTPIGEEDLFWFYFDYNEQELWSMPLMLGKLSAIHYFIGS